MSFEIRKANHNDATNMIAAHRRSIREVCSNDYNVDQITTWSGRNFQEEHWYRTMDKDLVWVLSDKEKNNIYGFGHLHFHDEVKAEIAGLYFVPEVIGLGFGKSMIENMLNECKNKKMQTVILSSTKTAKTFYQRMGFEQIGGQESINLGDQKIECFNMRLIL